jgi:hypothetical protein
VFNNKPLSASPRCLLMKDKAPRETKPAPRLKALHSLIVFRNLAGFSCLKAGHTLIGAGPCYQILESGRLLAHFSGWQRDALQLAA